MPGGRSIQCARDPVRVEALSQRVSEGFQKFFRENSPARDLTNVQPSELPVDA